MPLNIRYKQLIYIVFLAVLFLQCSIVKKQGSGEDNAELAFPFYYLALENVKSGDFEKAITLLDSAIKYQPAYSNFYTVKGQVFEFMGHQDSAIAAYEKSLAIKSYNPDAWIRLTELYMKKNDYDIATNYLKQSIAENPDSTQYLLTLAICYYKTEKYPLAINQLNQYKKITANPDPVYQKWLGLSYYEVGFYETAEDLLQNYFHNVGQKDEALKYLGLSRFHQKKYEGAITSLNDYLDINNRDADVYLYRSRYFLIQNKKGIAREQLELGLKLDSTNTSILYELALYYFNEDDLENSEEYLQRVIAIDPYYWESYKILGLIKERENNLEEALHFYTLYLENTSTEDADFKIRKENISKKLINR
jgi:tetratricopeptide (TPR) repeat protein